METMLTLAQSLRRRSYHHVLLLAHPKKKATLLAEWASAEGQRPALSVTDQPQHAHEAQVCVASVFDIQMHIGVERAQPFFSLFDAVVLCDDAATLHGPAWHQIVGIFTMRGTPVLELPALLSENSLPSARKDAQ